MHDASTISSCAIQYISLFLSHHIKMYLTKFFPSLSSPFPHYLLSFISLFLPFLPCPSFLLHYTVWRDCTDHSGCCGGHPQEDNLPPSGHPGEDKRPRDHQVRDQGAPNACPGPSPSILHRSLSTRYVYLMSYVPLF